MTRAVQAKTRQRSRPAKLPQQEISAALAALDQVKAETPEGARVISLLRSWLKDDSGYDEDAWPALRRALDQERVHVGARRLFDG